MNRMIFLTAIGLSIFSLCLNMTFADRISVQWHEIKLSHDEVIIRVENTGSEAWNGFYMTIRLFDGSRKPIQTASAKIFNSISPKTSELVKFPLPKSLTQGKEFQVEAYLQPRGNTKIATKIWEKAIVFDLTRRPEPVKNIGRISEPEALRHSIKGIEFKKAFGML